MINQIHLLGRVGKDPEFRTLDGGSKVSNFSLATTEKCNGEDKTEWHNITCWNKTAELASQYVKKGDLVHVVGKVQYETWQKDGQNHTTTRIICFNLTFVQKNKAHEAMKEELSNPVDNSQPTDDLPF